MKIVLAILTVLALIASPAGVSAIDSSRPACCTNCAGECCIQSGSVPVASQPIAPVSASPAPSVESVIPSLELAAFLCPAVVSRPSVPCDPSLMVVRAPLFRRCGGLLL